MTRFCPGCASAWRDSGAVAGYYPEAERATAGIHTRFGLLSATHRLGHGGTRTPRARRAAGLRYGQAVSTVRATGRRIRPPQPKETCSPSGSPHTLSIWRRTSRTTWSLPLTIAASGNRCPASRDMPGSCPCRLPIPFLSPAGNRESHATARNPFCRSQNVATKPCHRVKRCSSMPGIRGQTRASGAVHDHLMAIALRGGYADRVPPGNAFVGAPFITGWKNGLFQRPSGPTPMFDARQPGIEIPPAPKADVLAAAYFQSRRPIMEPYAFYLPPEAVLFPAWPVPQSGRTGRPGQSTQKTEVPLR